MSRDRLEDEKEADEEKRDVVASVDIETRICEPLF